MISTESETVLAAFAVAHIRAMLRRLVVGEMCDQDVEPDQSSIEAIVNAMEPGTRPALVDMMPTLIYGWSSKPVDLFIEQHVENLKNGYLPHEFNPTGESSDE